MTPAELREQITKLIAEDGEILHILERIAQKSADFGDSQNYMLKSGEISGAEFAKYVCGMGADERSAAVFGILWDRYKDGCGIFGGIQAIIDEKQGVHVAAQYADFPEVRAQKMANALCDPEAGDETIKRRAESAGNIVAAMHDDNIRANAEFRSRAGFTVHAQRIGGAKCCEWCASVTGKYAADDTPQGFWGRHDNCKCTILYDSRRGRQTLRGTGKRWAEQPAEGAGAAEPVTLTAEQARAAEGKNGLTKPAGSGTMEQEESPRKSKGGAYDVNWTVIQSPEYSDKFKKLSAQTAVSSSIETRSKWALNNRTGKRTEELYAVSLVDGREIARITDQHYDSGVKRTPSFTKRLDAADSRGEPIILLHNHPRGLPPSISDINALLRNTNVSGITVGHNGSVYRYTRPEREIPEFDWKVELRNFKEFTEITSMEKALEVLSKRYGFEFEIL